MATLFLFFGLLSVVVLFGALVWELFDSVAAERRARRRIDAAMVELDQTVHDMAQAVAFLSVALEGGGIRGVEYVVQ